MVSDMRTPIFVRALTDEERTDLRTGLRSSDGVQVRRCQMVLASARGERSWRAGPPERRAGGRRRETGAPAPPSLQSAGAGSAAAWLLTPAPAAAAWLLTHQPPPGAFPGERAEQLRALVHRSPRDVGHPTRLWTLDLAAEVSFAHGLTDQLVTGEAIRMTVLRLGIGWKRAKHCITSPDPAYVRKKPTRPADRAGGNASYLGGELRRRGVVEPLGAAAWRSRLAQPHLPSWAAADQPWRLVEQPWRLVEQTVAKADPDPKALACYGLLLRRAGQDEAVWLRFVTGRPVTGRPVTGRPVTGRPVTGRPVRAITLQFLIQFLIQFLAWCCPKREALGVPVWALGVPVWALIWDNASWHVRKAVRAWIRTHNRAVKHLGQGVRILVCDLPVKSPWLNPIEPQGVHSQRAIVEPTRLLSAHEVADRVCAYHRCPHEPHLSLPEPIQDKVS
jgi:hypothetical protein